MPLRLPPLETEHLLVRDFEAGDFDVVHRILDQEGSFGDGISRTKRKAWFDWSIANYEALASLYQPPWGERAVTLKETGEIVGVVGFSSLFHPLSEILEGKEAGKALHQPEIGLFWVITPGHRGKGFAAEAARALIDHAFTNFRLKRIVANTEFDNKASQAVMKKLGMRLIENTKGEPDWFEVLGVLDNRK